VAEEVLPPELKNRLCTFLKSTLDSAIKVIVEAGRIERPEEFSSLVYWITRLNKTYECPTGSTSQKEQECTDYLVTISMAKSALTDLLNLKAISKPKYFEALRQLDEAFQASDCLKILKGK